ncbi:hypothetical protein MMC11_000732 [Xylographa trunciseda]|nr:hypothetical protein [Xylographa trunciseda]
MDNALYIAISLIFIAVIRYYYLSHQELRRKEAVRLMVKREIRKAWDADEPHRDERLKYTIKQEIRKALDAQSIISGERADLLTLSEEQIVETGKFFTKAC